ncbi:hypothetical protein diail_2429 [Diaporthe ilicicola]|nr:hypothetical protein diail_2429 [Diaporthe ilicicola]
MSSLQSIMNVDEDQHDASSSTDKRDKDPATPVSGFRSQNPSSSSIQPGHVIPSSQQPSSTQLAEGSEAARSIQQHVDEGSTSTSTSAVQQGKRPAVTSDPRDTTSAATAPTIFRAEQQRRESNTSVDSMDQHGYGSAASSSSMGGASGGGLPPNHPRRPMGSPNPEVPIRLTPITGRVSRAKKGVPVHTCDMCNPPKREIQGTGSLDAVTTSHYVTTPFSMSPHMAPAPYHPYGPLLDPSLMAEFADDQTQQSLLDVSIASHPVAHHRSPSVRSPSHPPSPAQGADTLVTPAALPNRAAPMAHVSRQKEMVMSDGNMVGGVGIYPVDGSSPSWPSNDPGDILTGPALASLGGCGSGGTSVVTNLGRSVRNSIASYLDVYWDKFHGLYPFIHRGTVESAGEDALKCAMAAIATQYLDNKDDRIRGNQLHEYAWQEAKRYTQYTQYSQWNLQIKQAILLCELFSRFRGRKASVRPSKLFENLYLRVSGSQSLVSSASDNSHSSLPVSRSDSSSIPSLSSSAGVYTPSLPAWSPQSSEPTSASSPRNGIYQFDYTRHGSSSVLFSPTVSFSPQQISSSPNAFILNPGFQAYNNVSLNNAYFPFTSVGQEQSYSNSFSPQVLEHNTTVFNTASLGNSSMGITMTDEERWHTWIGEEARRRLLTVCFIIDNHTSLYHQQPRARDDIDPSTIPLTGHSDALWAAGSAIEWANVLETSPAANVPHFIPRPNTLTPDEVARHSFLDKVAILHAEASRLPRRQYNRSSTDHDDQSSYTADDLRTPTTASYNQNFSSAYSEERIVHLFSMTTASPGPSIYLALHHTPLHDLLAVSGDSWVFSQKVLGASTFLENQKRLKTWAEGRLSSKSPSSQQQASAGSLEGMSCAQATCHAARALLDFLQDDGATAPQAVCISKYWGMYVCALIIWAFGHRAARSSSSTSPQKAPLPEDEAISWLQAIGMQRPEDATRMKHRREASAGVVSLVKRRLDADCVGPRSQLYVDAVGVLKKLEEGVNRRWF